MMSSLESTSPVEESEEVALRIREQMMLEKVAQKYHLEARVDVEELFDEVDYAQINAFADRPFSGNPAAVCYLPYPRSDKWMQVVAREFNLAETAFLVKRINPPSDDKKPKKRKGLVQVDESGKKLKAVKSFTPAPADNEFDLRWFTPMTEVDLCGHATLASAHLLFSSGIVDGNTVVFHTKSGILKANKVSGYQEFDGPPPDERDPKPAKRRQPSDKGVVELDFPSSPPTACSDSSLLSEALGGVEIRWVGRSDVGDYLVELQSSEDVDNLNPNFEKMVDFPGRGGVIVTALAAANTEYDFISRFFCPKMGINEDPATGSAHCALGPYWSSKLKKTELNAYQASERGAKFLVRVDEEAGRCYLQGGVFLVMAGTLLGGSLQYSK